MASWDEFPEYQHANCGGLVEIKNAETMRDAGAERETRVHPCTKGTWCLLERDHVGECMNGPERAPAERPAWDTKTPDPKGWRKR